MIIQEIKGNDPKSMGRTISRFLRKPPDVSE
jgi:hypothetical protein